MRSPWNVVHAGAMAALLVLVSFTSALPLAVAGAAALVALLVVERPRGTALGLGLANLITLARVGLVVVGALCTQRLHAAAVFLLVWALDGVDGLVARARNEASAFGARFDLETDALFVAALSATVVALAGAPAWVLVAGLLRYALVVARAFLPHEARIERRSQFGRFAYSLSVVCLLGGLLELPSPWETELPALGVVVLCASFSQDFIALRRHPRRG